ncbi:MULTISPECIES: YggT family protein [Ruminobacter]|uniref:YggT family protein n=2 Tax=Succinivibrionaceae TaxID=83763 RepID=A0A662ZGJ3_9GAMM|nr:MULTISPECIES: YggT family protein [Ruminobacter]SFP10638.1 YggT family protein [Ruminobacter amylophilus]
MLTLLFNFPVQFLMYIPGMIFFLRFLMQYARCDFYHPVSQFVYKVTAPFLKVFRNLCFDNINVAALLNMVLIPFIIFTLFSLQGVQDGFSSVSLKDFAVLFAINIVFVVWTVIEILLILLIVTAVLSWIPSARGINIYLLTLLKPVTGFFDKYIPSIGYISLSFLVVFLLLQFIDSTIMPRFLFFVIGLAK